MSDRTDNGGGDLVTVAVVSKPHGVDGALRVRVETHNPGRFRPGNRLLADVGGARRSFTVSKFVLQGEWGILTLAEVAGRDAAEALRGAELGVRQSELAALPAGSYYTFQIIGLAVRSPAGAELGAVAVVEELPAGDVYVVRGAAGEFRVPSRGGFIRSIDLAAGTMVIDDVEGLR
ncbi:MAG: ribosome maturation factor RimM [Candidatus Edwardsbacteria bacterium]|nr:ribosome maturation factor RimM [Candidatus Edwardsbacteria bacterium]